MPTATWTEQFGRVIVEAHASGAVVAGYATGAIPETASGAAILAQGGDVDGLAREVSAVLADPRAYADLRKQGLELSRGRTWERVAEQQAALYGQAAETGATAVPLPRSPRLRRVAASREFGPPARTTAGLRPFALPWLRRGGFVARVLGAAIDAVAELKARIVRASASAEKI